MRLFRALLILAVPAMANADAVSDLRQAARAGDVTQALTILQDAPSAFAAFATSDPAMRALAGAMQAAAPASPEAGLARAWALWDEAEAIAWNANPAAMPDAVTERDSRLRQALPLAEAALDHQPAAAADLVIRIAATLGDKTRGRRMLDEVMTAAPAYDRLRDALPFVLPDGPEVVTALQEICTAHAANLPGTDRMTPDECTMHFNTALELGGPLDLLAGSVINGSTHPRLVPQKAVVLLDQRSFGPEAIPLMLEYFAGAGREDFMRASAFDEYHGRHRGLAPLRFATLTNRLERIERDLGDDPHDPQLLMDMILTRSEMLGLGATDEEHAALKALSFETNMKIVTVAPYAGASWYSLGWAIMPEVIGPDVAPATAYFAQSIRVSGYDHRQIQPDLYRQMTAYSQTAQMMWRQHNAKPLQDDFDVSEADLDSMLTCPIIRNIRLAIRSCSAAGIAPAKCFRGPVSLQEAFGFAAMTEERGACTEEFALSDDQLDYDAPAPFPKPSL